jgi:hypothetical protein
MGRWTRHLPGRISAFADATERGGRERRHDVRKRTTVVSCAPGPPPSGPARPWWHPGRLARWAIRPSFWREVVLVALAMLAYFGIRNVTAGSADAAAANAGWLLGVERDLGIAWEDGIQEAIVGDDTLVTLANWVYIWGHWPVILSAAIVLFVVRRERYFLLRNAFFISGAIGFLFYAFFPVAPPRLLDLGLVDTVTQRSDAYRALQPPGLTNQFAAFPSLHAGWNILLGVVLVLSSAAVLVRLFAILVPAAMSLAVVATANHFVIDVAGGLAVVLVGLLGAVLLGRWRGRARLVADGVAGDGPARHPLGRAAVRRGAPRGQPP